jgi:hypothetical protein
MILFELVPVGRINKAQYRTVGKEFHPRDGIVQYTFVHRMLVSLNP